jgi:hypothetical protein
MKEKQFNGGNSITVPANGSQGGKHVKGKAKGKK